MTGEAAAVTDRPQNPRVLVSAASLHGATAEIAQTIGEVLSRHNFATTVMAPGEVDAIDDYDAVIIGSAVYMGHWLDPAKELVSRSVIPRASWPRRWAKIPPIFPHCSKPPMCVITGCSLASSTAST